MSVAAQAEQLFPGVIKAFRFPENVATMSKHLVAPEDEGGSRMRRNFSRLHLCERVGNIPGRCLFRLHRFTKRYFVDAGRLDVERYAGIAKQLLADFGS